MNWHFWLHNRPAASPTGADNCARVRPLLSLMSDNMASAQEKRQVVAHLATCAACRQAQTWMLATRQVIAERPAVLPPADMRTRIAQALAESKQATPPVAVISARPARRTFALRPAIAAAASLVLGGVIVGHALLTAHSPAHQPVKPTAPLTVAEVPYASNPAGGEVPLVVPQTGHAGTSLLPTRRIPGAAHSAKEARVPTTTRPEEIATSLPSVPKHSAAPTPTHLALPHTPSQPLLAFGAPRTPAAGAAPHTGVLVAKRPPTQNPALTHPADSHPLLAAVPPTVEHTPTPAPSVALPAPTTNHVPAATVAAVPPPTPVEPRAPQTDALSGIRLALASRHTGDYGHKLQMAGYVHVPGNFGIVGIYTPTVINTVRVGHRAAAEARPAALSAPAESPATLPSTDLRRSQRDRTLADASPVGGA